jgi:Flp pilus assembly protein TadG
VVEFALVFPVVCALLFGIIDAGRFVGSRVMLSQAAAEAARTACLYSTTGTADVDTAFTGASSMLVGATVDWGNSTCTGPCAGYPRAAGDVVWMQVRYDFQAIFFRSWFTRTLTQTSRMVCE